MICKILFKNILKLKDRLINIDCKPFAYVMYGLLCWLIEVSMYQEKRNNASSSNLKTLTPYSA